MSNLITKPEFTDKDTSILNEVAFADGLYPNGNDEIALAKKSYIAEQRGQKLDKVFYNSNGSVNTQVVTEGTALYYNLTNNPEYYKDSLSKYTLVETTSTIVAKPGGYTDDGLLYQGEQTYHGLAVTDGIATGFVNRGTDGVTDLTQDAQMALYQSNPPYVQQSVDFMKDVYLQQMNHDPSDNVYELASVAKDNVFTTGFSLGKPGSDAQALYALESGKNLMGNVSFEGYGTTEILQRANPEAFAIFGSVLESLTTSYVRTNDAVSQNFASTQFGNVVPITSGYGVADGFIDLFNGVNLHGIKNYRFSAYDAEGKIIPDQLNTVMTQKYLSDLDTQANELNQQIQHLSTTDYVIEYAEYLADRAEPLYFNNDNLFNKLDQVDTKKDFFEKVFGGYSNYNGVDNIRYSVDNMVIDALGGNPANQNIFQTLSKSISEQPNAEIKSQFIDLLRDSDIIQNVMDSILATDGISAIRTIDQLVSEKFIQANTQLYGDPLVVDLDGDGIETRTADGSVLFDHDADGQATGTGWAAADDGLLVRDLDGSGTIDTGRELFGDNTIKADGSIAKDGFDALSDLDNNNDGVFNSADEAFDTVQIWQDKDQDGITDSTELINLAAAGIESIDLNAHTVNQDVAGGVLHKSSTVTKADGTTAAIGAMDFAENKFYSKFAQAIELSDNLQGLINVAGHGALRSLHEAASKSPKLDDLLQNLYSGDAPITNSVVHEVLLEWARSAEDFTTSLELIEGITLDDGTQINLDISNKVKTIIEKTAVLEAINGERLLEYQITDNGSNYSVNIRTGVETSDFVNGGTSASKGSKVSLNDWDFHRLVDNGRTTLINDAYANLFNTVQDSVQTNYVKNNIQPFLLENISFEFSSDGDVALNLDGVNTELINMIKSNPAQGINFFNKLREYQSQTFLKGYWDSQFVLENDIPAALSEMLEADVILNDAEKMNFKVNGKLYTIGSLVGTGSSDFILGQEQDDSIGGGSGNDTLMGGAGNDTLIGDSITTSSIDHDWDRYYEARSNKGNDTLAGGRGDDSLAGGYGSDTYIFNKGDGVDTIQEMLKNGHNLKAFDKDARDTIRFGEGLTKENIILSILENDVLINFKDNKTDQLILKDFMLDNTINNFEFADGSKLTRDGLMSLSPIYATDGDDIIKGYNSSETIYGGSGDDSLSGRSGSDRLYGGLGSDKLYGDNHNDELYGGAGDDYLRGGSQSDILYGGDGNDTLIGDNITTSSVDHDWGRYYEARSNKGNDILAGGRGDDSLAGGYGSDTYIFNKGDGVDTIQEMLKNGHNLKTFDKNARDTIKFGEGLVKENVLLDLSGSDLLVSFKDNETDRLILKDFMLDNTIDNFEFADGSKLTRGDFMSLDVLEGTNESDIINGYGGSETIYAGAGGDNLHGNSGADKLYGEEGDDYIKGGNQDDLLSGASGSDKLYGDNHNDELYGGAGDDYLRGGSQSDKLYGGDGNDTLVGDNITTSSVDHDWGRYYEARSNKGNDILAGGRGDDSLAGGYGSDTYIFNKGDGVDTIQEMLKNGHNLKIFDKNARDTIKFGEGISADDLNFKYNGNDVHVTFSGFDADKLIFKDFQASTLDKFEFSDGSILYKSDIKIGTDSEDNLTGNTNDNIIAGNDGNDIITGGRGDDILTGGQGADIYNYSLGDGNDTIRLSNDDAIDILKLNDIDKDQISLAKVGDDLQINLGEAMSSVNLKDYFDEQVEANGLIIEADDEFQMMLSANSAKMAEILASMSIDDDDGGSVDSSNQVITEIDASQLADLWSIKKIKTHK